MPSRPFVVYLCGIILFGFFYEPLKSRAPSGLVFFLGSLAYLLFLRLLGAWLERSEAAPRA